MRTLIPICALLLLNGCSKFQPKGGTDTPIDVADTSTVPAGRGSRPASPSFTIAHNPIQVKTDEGHVEDTTGFPFFTKYKVTSIEILDPPANPIEIKKNIPWTIAINNTVTFTPGDGDNASVNIPFHGDKPTSTGRDYIVFGESITTLVVTVDGVQRFPSPGQPGKPTNYYHLRICYCKGGKCS